MGTAGGEDFLPPVDCRDVEDGTEDADISDNDKQDLGKAGHNGED